jgi:glucose-1-phosphate thymidylyltransferase
MKQPTKTRSSGKASLKQAKRPSDAGENNPEQLMKVVCPIAGVGKRLQPFTFTKPKAFLKVAGKMIIDHAMDMLMDTFPEKTEILFVVGYKKEMIIKHITEQYGDYFTLRFEEQQQRGIIDDVPIFPGLGHAICIARECGFLPEDNSTHGMFVFLSDRLPIDGFKGLHEAFLASNFDGIISASNVDHPEHYGVIKVDDNNQITLLIEKPKEFISNLSISGIYEFNVKATNEILDYLQEMVKTPIPDDKEYQLTPALQNLVEKNYRLTIYQMKSEIIDIGRTESFIAGNKFFLEKAKLNTEFHQVENAHIIQPSYIGKNVTVKNSIVGPFVSVGDNVEINNSIIQNSAIGDNSSLMRVITSESIIGDGCHLEDIIKSHITVGDRSIIASGKNSD